MSVRFILGRAGTGKTAHCIGAIRELLLEDPAGLPRLLLLVPEQASFQMEQALLADPLEACSRCEVLSFKRLAFKVLAEHGSDTPVLSSFARSMVVRHLLARHAPDLRYFSRAAVSPAAFKQLSETLVELFEQNLSPEQLTAEGVAAKADPLLAAKLHDLARLHEAYLEYLGSDRLDAAQHLDQARSRLTRCRWLHNTRLWVDGFAGFTAQEIALLGELLTLTDQAEITFLLDPVDPIADDPSVAPDPYSLFSPTQRTFAQLRDHCIRSGLRVDEPLGLHSDTPPRFTNAPQIARLERNLFRWPKPDIDDGPDPADKARASVRLIEAADRRTEVAFAVSQIRRWASRRDDPIRYRHLAVIVRDLDRYHDLLVAELSARSIPFFIDRRRNTAHHPLVELLRALTAVPAAGFSLPAVRLGLKTEFLACPHDQADELENYLLAHGIEGYDAWTGPAWTFHRDLTREQRDEPLDRDVQLSLERIDAARRAFFEPLADWFGFAVDGTHTIESWVRAVRNVFERLAVRGKINAMIQDAVDDGHLEQAEEHRQVFADIDALLTDLVDALGGESVDAGELGALLESGLAELSVALPPPTLDQVLVGSIERSRHPHLRAACLLGFNESVFPLSASEDPVLGDDDRETLAQAGLQLRPTRRQRLIEERYLAYVALTRPAEQLVVCYPVADENADPLKPSPFVHDLREALPSLTVEKIDDPTVSRELWALHTPPQLAAALAFEFRSRPADPADDAPDARGRFNALYLHARDDESTRRPVAHALAALTYENQAALLPEDVERLYPLPLKTSVSQLEQFSACPFKHFAGYGLGLEERPSADLQNLDLGSLLHKVLENLVVDLIAEKKRFDDLDDRQISRRVDEALQRYAPNIQEELAYRQPRNRFLFQHARSHLIDAMRLQRELARVTRLTPVGTEIAFGIKKPGSLPPLDMTTPKGRRILLRGVVDRVDVVDVGDEQLAVVHDYKRSLRRRLSVAEVYHGLSLQLPAYLLAMRNLGKFFTGKSLRPVAGFFVNLLRSVKTLSRHPDPMPDDGAMAARFKPRGLIDANALTLLDDSVESGRSTFFNAAVRKDGQPAYLDRSDLASPAAFDAVLARAADHITRLADEMLDGRIDVKPYRLGNRSPCTYCPYRDVCRFEYHPANVRALTPMKRSAVFMKMAGTRKEADS